MSSNQDVRCLLDVTRLDSGSISSQPSLVELQERAMRRFGAIERPPSLPDAFFPVSGSSTSVQDVLEKVLLLCDDIDDSFDALQ